MFRFALRRPSPAMLVALTALFVALGGGAYAAVTTLPANSVGTAQLKTSAVISSKVKDHSLLGQDTKPGQFPPGVFFNDTTGGTSVRGPKLRKPGTYFLEVESNVNSGPTAANATGHCGIGARSTSSFVGGFNAAWSLETSASGNFSFSGVLVIPKGTTPAYTSIQCFDTTQTTVTQPDGARWWYWKLGS